MAGIKPEICKKFMIKVKIDLIVSKQILVSFRKSDFVLSFVQILVSLINSVAKKTLIA